MLPPPEHGFWTTFEPCFDWMTGRSEVIERRADALLALLSPSPGLRVLELDCGPAHHALELARRGVAMTAIDERSRWLENARRRARGVPIELITTAHHDIARRAGVFDAVLHLGGWFGSRGTADDDRRLLAAAFRTLVPGGRLVIELHTQESLVRARPDRGSRALGAGHHWVETWQIDRSWRQAEICWMLLEEERKAVGGWTLRLYSRRRLEDLLRTVGFGTIRWPRLPWPAERWQAGELVLAHREVKAG